MHRLIAIQDLIARCM